MTSICLIIINSRGSTDLFVLDIFMKQRKKPTPKEKQQRNLLQAQLRVFHSLEIQMHFFVVVVVPTEIEID
jgi:hypothetical protein